MEPSVLSAYGGFEGSFRCVLLAFSLPVKVRGDFDLSDVEEAELLTF